MTFPASPYTLSSPSTIDTDNTKENSVISAEAQSWTRLSAFGCDCDCYSRIVASGRALSGGKSWRRRNLRSWTSETASRWTASGRKTPQWVRRYRLTSRASHTAICWKAGCRGQSQCRCYRIYTFRLAFHLGCPARSCSLAHPTSVHRSHNLWFGRAKLIQSHLPVRTLEVRLGWIGAVWGRTISWRFSTRKQASCHRNSTH